MRGTLNLNLVIAVKIKQFYVVIQFDCIFGFFVGGTKYLDRTGSMRADDFNQPQMVRNRAKKVSLFNVIIPVE